MTKLSASYSAAEPSSVTRRRRGSPTRRRSADVECRDDAGVVGRPLLPIGRQKLRVVVRAEAHADVLETEEPDTCSGGRRRDEHDEVPSLRLEPPVPIRAPARVAERPTPPGAPSREPDRRMLGPPRCRGSLHEEHESRLVCAHEQGTGAGGVAAENGRGKALRDIALYCSGRRPHRGCRAATRERQRNQQAADHDSMEIADASHDHEAYETLRMITRL
jgi:hypothetical protein